MNNTDPVLIRNQFMNFPAQVKRRLLNESLYNATNWRRLLHWLDNNLLDGLDKGIILDEIDKTLSYQEAKDHIASRHPEWFKCREKVAKAKQIVFVSKLIPFLLAGEARCTYRNRRLYGIYYVVTSRFVRHEPSLVIEVTKNELVDMNKLTCKDARLAGVESAEELRSLLRRWYGHNSVIFRNWLIVTQVL